MFEQYEGDNPGAAIVVLHDGEVVLRECHGLADLEARVPVTPETNFRLASLTKPFIAQAIGLLVRRGALRYGDVVFDVATVHELLTHTSSVVDYEELIDVGPRPTLSGQVGDEDVLRMLTTTNRTGFHYSNTGYVLLGLLIERVTGGALEDFLRDEIFAPLGMHGTTLGPPRANRAYGYDRDGGQWVRRDQSVTSATRGDGGIYSSIDDLALWARSLGDDVPCVDTNVPGVRYGHGWFFADGAIYHYGDTVSFRTGIVRVPHATAIVLTNRNEGDALALVRSIIL